MTEQKRSSWDETVTKSAYHFNPTRMDPRWDTVVGLGYIVPNWEDDLEGIITNAKPAQWANRGYKGEGIEAPPADLAAEEYDLERIGADPKMTVSHIGWALPPSLQKIVTAFGMNDTMARLHMQMPGEVWTRHIDKLQKWNYDDTDSILRVMIQLTDWQPGQFWEYGNYHHRGWGAGEVTTFDWKNLPHCTANAGHHPRVTLQLTGVKTSVTDAFLNVMKNTDACCL